MVGSNESQRHKRYKQKVANILRHYDFTVYGDREAREGIDDEVRILRQQGSFPYFVDLYASNGKRVLVVEIDGYRGHSTRRAILKDAHRTAFIKEKIPDAEVYRFTFSQLKDTTDDLIAQELRLDPT